MRRLSLSKTAVLERIERVKLCHTSQTPMMIPGKFYHVNANYKTSGIFFSTPETFVVEWLRGILNDFGDFSYATINKVVSTFLMDFPSKAASTYSLSSLSRGSYLPSFKAGEMFFLLESVALGQYVKKQDHEFYQWFCSRIDWAIHDLVTETYLPYDNKVRRLEKLVKEWLWQAFHEFVVYKVFVPGRKSITYLCLFPYSSNYITEVTKDFKPGNTTF